MRIKHADDITESVLNLHQPINANHNTQISQVSKRNKMEFPLFLSLTWRGQMFHTSTVKLVDILLTNLLFIFLSNPRMFPSSTDHHSVSRRPCNLLCFPAEGNPTILKKGKQK